MVISSRVAVQATLCLYHDPPTECNGNYTKAKFGKGGVVSVIRVGIVNGDLVFARSGSLMELYGPDVIVLLMNLWVFNGVVKWSCMVLNGMV